MKPRGQEPSGERVARADRVDDLDRRGRDRHGIVAGHHERPVGAAGDERQPGRAGASGGGPGIELGLDPARSSALALSTSVRRSARSSRCMYARRSGISDGLMFGSSTVSAAVAAHRSRAPRQDRVGERLEHQPEAAAQRARRAVRGVRRARSSGSAPRPRCPRCRSGSRRRRRRRARPAPASSAAAVATTVATPTPSSVERRSQAVPEGVIGDATEEVDPLPQAGERPRGVERTPAAVGREPVVAAGHQIDQRLAGDDDHPVSLGGCREGGVEGPPSRPGAARSQQLLL